MSNHQIGTVTIKFNLQDNQTLKSGYNSGFSHRFEGSLRLEVPIAMLVQMQCETTVSGKRRGNNKGGVCKRMGCSQLPDWLGNWAMHCLNWTSVITRIKLQSSVPNS